MSLLVMAPVLAGCLGADDTQGDDANPNTNNNSSNTIDNSQPIKSADGRKISAFDETNKTEMGRGGMDHKHDYWGGSDRYTVMQDDWWFIPIPLMPKTGEPTGTAVADLAPEIGKLVPEGTKQIEIVLKEKGAVGLGCTVRGQPLPVCAHHTTHPQANMAFKYVTANDNLGEWREGGPLDDGVAFTFDVAPHEADMPHSTASLWIFRIYSMEPTSIYFNITITAIRGHEVVNWPGHPDFYHDKPSRTVFDGPFSFHFGGWQTWWAYGDDSTWVVPEKLISWGTTRIEVYINISSAKFADGTDPLWDGWALDYHNATDQPRIGTTDLSMTEVQDPDSDGTSYHFTILADDASYDSPYGSVSRWGFRLLPIYREGHPSGGHGCTEECPAFDIEATVKIVTWDDNKLAGKTTTPAE